MTVYSISPAQVREGTLRHHAYSRDPGTLLPWRKKPFTRELRVVYDNHSQPCRLETPALTPTRPSEPAPPSSPPSPPASPLPWEPSQWKTASQLMAEGAQRGDIGQPLLAVPAAHMKPRRSKDTATVRDRRARQPLEAEHHVMGDTAEAILNPGSRGTAPLPALTSARNDVIKRGGAAVPGARWGGVRERT